MSQTTIPVLDHPLPAARTAAIEDREPPTPVASVPVASPPVSRSVRRALAEGNWTQWILLVAFIFIALESTLMALVMQGRWLILIAPGAVCASKAWEQWKVMKGS